MRRLVLLAALVCSSLSVFGLMPGTGLAASTVLMGNSSVASVADNDAAGLAEAFRFAATASARPNSASVYVDTGSTATAVVVGIYTDDGGQPGSLLATGTNSGPVAGQWNQVTLAAAPYISSGTTYWLAVLGTGGQLNIRDLNSSSTCSENSSQSTLTSLPSSWSSGADWNSCALSAYVSGWIRGGSALSAPVDTALPVISGQALLGQTLSATAGTWSSSPSSVAYQWEDCDTSGANCTAISGATGSSYGLASADVGDTIRVVVTATNSAGSANATSASTSTVTSAPSAPTNTALPVVSGTAQQGDTLSTTNGSWTGSPTSYTYQWQDNGTTNISGATSSSYVARATDVGDTLDVVVTAQSAAGTGSGTSARTATVTSSGGGGGTGCLQMVNSSGFSAFENPLATNHYPNYADLDACGYPSPDTAGVPSGTSLTTVSSTCNCLPSGDSYSGGELSIGSTATVSNISMPDGYVVLGVSGATITDSVLRCNVCNAGGGIIAPQGHSVTITHTTVGGTGGGSDCTSPSSQDIGPSNGGGTLLYDVFDCSVEPINGSGFTLKNSYVIVDGYLSGSHNEDFYMPGRATGDIENNTLLDPLSSVASIFQDCKNGAMGTTTISGNLFSGAGYGDGMMTGGGSNVTVSGNSFSNAYGSSMWGGVDSATQQSGNFADSNGASVTVPSAAC